MAPRTTKFDIADHLDDDEAVAIYLTEALETGDASYVAHALGKIARARGMAKVATATGLGRETLYKTLSESGNPELATVLKIMSALNVKLVAEKARKRRAKAAAA